MSGLSAVLGLIARAACGLATAAAAAPPAWGGAMAAGGWRARSISSASLTSSSTTRLRRFLSVLDAADDGGGLGLGGGDGVGVGAEGGEPLDEKDVCLSGRLALGEAVVDALDGGQHQGQARAGGALLGHGVQGIHGRVDGDSEV